MIQIKDLKFTYPNNQHSTLEVKSLDIQKGEHVFLFGPSGTGKSTFLEILSGVLQAQNGLVQILGQDLTKMSPQQRDSFRAEHIGYIFQSLNLLYYLSVYENIELGILFSKNKKNKLSGLATNRDREQLQGNEKLSKSGKSNIKNEIHHLAESLGIAHLLQKKTSELSVGQQQRVAVARALLGGPELILADEPTSALDTDNRQKFIELLFKVVDEYKSTVIFVSHDLSLQNLFHRTISLSEINLVHKNNLQNSGLDQRLHSY